MQDTDIKIPKLKENFAYSFTVVCFMVEWEDGIWLKKT